ncbi:F-box/SPRY domain-containing protein 1 [Elysia marginata]|uniref:F-box/SPRY domain-containing protein 1 n=1 Tax=Elysia marginata TaxID=1093978 RepID=A0AAV4GKY8_9GAST|nr:F-box/SPRY domain-containing protein 1 [Elysia marginata]
MRIQLHYLRQHFNSNKKDDDDDDDDDDEEEESQSFWDHVGGIVVLGGISLIGAGLFSLTAWIVCSCHEKFTKRRVSNSPNMVAGPGKHPTNPPAWSRNLTIQPELTIGFGMMSEGFYSLSNVNLLRQRSGATVTDGAKWAAPLTTGKHLFEIIWPWGCRGYHSTVGVAIPSAPVKAKGGVCLVGGNTHSWGLDIVQRRAIHNNKTLVTCPTDGSYVPDRFLMYVDVDEGTLGFGNEVTFWGYVITGLPKGKQLFPMIGTDKWEANVQLFYRGSAGTAGFDPYSSPGPSYALPPMTDPLPPKYADVFQVPLGEPGAANDPARARSAWEMTPPPPPSAPADAPPPYTSPPPQY